MVLHKKHATKRLHEADTRHTDPYHALKELNIEKLKYFGQFPLAKPTLNALKSNGFVKPTEIQKLVIKQILEGRDIVAEAATGSGKTLAFLIPMLDVLYTNNVTNLDGPVAVILTPTRELARQITLVLKRLCSFFKFTMLNIMGGKSSMLKKQEWSTVSRANILIGTPGRLAQHQTENALLDLSNLRMLILDEADRLLDPTFRGDVDTILTNLSPDRQTLLFSATQTHTITQLARIGLRDPVILSTQSRLTGASIPSELTQYYSIVPLEQKLDTLWTFLQSHCKKKIIVFFSTQKQVRYTYELFHQLRPFFRVMQLRGNMQLPKRFKVYDTFMSAPQGCVLLATNVAERGLDFPSVHWVVQYDCPRQLDDYVHRVGRTARFGQTGRALTFLLPSETRLIDLLYERGVELKLQKFRESKINRFVSNRVAPLLASKPELAVAARVAFSAYLRDYCLGAGSPNRSTDVSQLGISGVFDPRSLPLNAFALSLGLAFTPELPARLLQWTNAQSSSAKMDIDAAVRNVGLNDIHDTGFGGHDTDDSDEFLVRKPEYASKLTTSSQSLLRSGVKLLDVVEEDEDEEVDEEDVSEPQQPEITVVPATEDPISNKQRRRTRVQRAKSELKRNIRTHTKIQFDSEGQPLAKTVGNVPILETIHTDSPSIEPDVRLDIETERQRLRHVDKEDQRLWRERRKELNRMKRRKKKELMGGGSCNYTLNDGWDDASDSDDPTAEKLPRV